MIYIQSDSDRLLPHHFDAACAMYGAIDSGMKYRLTSFEELASGKFDAMLRRHTFVGSTDFMREVFKRMGLNDVRLPMNSDRESTIITLSEALERSSKGEKLFIKPVDIKLFTGLVLDGMIYTSIKSHPGDTKVMAYEPFGSKIVSEWRIYVSSNTPVDSRNYSGNFRIGPDYGHVIDVLAKNMGKFPAAYTIDIGILEDGTNVVVEFNDMWAIGNYGMPNDLYLRLLRERYSEIATGDRFSI